MSVESDSLRGVRSIYGTREVGGAVGVVKTEGVKNQLAVDLDEVYLTAGEYATVKIPAGSMLVAAFVEITEAFAMGGTSPTILVGTSGSEVTNGCVVSEALGEAVGTTDITSTLTGTWAEGESLAAETTVGVVLGGTSPTATGGKGRVIVEYVKAIG